MESGALSLLYSLKQRHYFHSNPAFTIVELLIVIVIIGILVAITIVSYSGINQRSIVVMLQSDLANASKQIKMYQIVNDTYPTTIDCSAVPAANSICLKSSSNNVYAALQINNALNPQTFCLTAVNSGIKYRITDSSIPEVGTCNSALTDGLIGYYPFNGDVKDYSGNGKNGTVYGATLTNGVFGQAYSFDGVNDYVEVAQGHNMLTVDSTISMWIYSTSWTHQAYISFIGSRQIGNDGVMFFVTTTGALSCDWGSNRWATGYTMPLSQWIHMVITRDGTGRKLYINGSLINSTAAAGGPTTANTVLQIGDVPGSSYYHQGKIDDVRIYNRALSQGEVTTLFNL